MSRLIKEALRGYEFGEPTSSEEIDRGFNRAVDAFMERSAKKRKQQNLQRAPPQPPGKQYSIKGHFSEDSMPIPLEDSFRATSLKKAKEVTRKMAIQSHNVEGYAVSLNLFDRLDYPRRVLYSFEIDAKKE